MSMFVDEGDFDAFVGRMEDRVENFQELVQDFFNGVMWISMIGHAGYWAMKDAVMSRKEWILARIHKGPFKDMIFQGFRDIATDGDDDDD